ncbi:MAG TPA: NAD(P)-dependent oxidoreductase [Galbitalea sp.]|nr:NAD(P)-dependent oxidoreductase [Galbitalea sp.]
MAHGERLGVLGVGRMGAPIARNLATAGFDVTVYDLDPTRCGRTRASVADSASQLAELSDILITVLPGIAEIEAAMIGPRPLVESMRPGSLWLDLTSNDPRVARAIAERASARGVDSVGAPMAGGADAAENGSLRFYAGGAPSAIDRARPVLAVVGSIEQLGTAMEAGYVAKLLANLLWFGQAVAVTEALLLGQALGLSPTVLHGQLSTSAGGSVFIDEYLDHLLDGDYLETFGIDRCVEELETLVSLARGADVPFELSTTVEKIHRDALGRFGAIDGELLGARLLEERAGRTLRR